MAGTISVLTLIGRQVPVSAKITTGTAQLALSGLAFTRGGKAALVSSPPGGVVSVPRVDRTIVTADLAPIPAGVRPYSLDINAAGTRTEGAALPIDAGPAALRTSLP